MCAYTEYENFLSHPIEEKKYLIDHCLEVAKKSKELILQTKFGSADTVYYAGLLHDIGKLNQYYQEIFHAEKENREEVIKRFTTKYERVHSPFSCWAAKKLLGKNTGLDKKKLNQILSIVYGHHSRLLHVLPRIDKGERFLESQKTISFHLENFKKQVLSREGFSELDWNRCLEQFKEPISFQGELKTEFGDYIHEFLEINVLFSSLLQADRGSFSQWRTPEFDMAIDTTQVVKTESNLRQFRESFQKNALMNHDFEANIIVIEAPTGIGKTKVFLDLINRYKEKQKLERVFYFSPLLALTEDFERKISVLIKKEDFDDLLIYNHIFSGTLSAKLDEKGIIEDSQWFFEHESFNKKLIITTTQRFLMTLYSNKASDKLKLISLKNSLLILDEVQIIPKFILANLLKLLQNICKYMNAKVLLVSATIPHELTQIKKNTIPENIKESYLHHILKNISFLEPLTLPNSIENKTLFMANTKKKASNIYLRLEKNFKDKQLIYISTGIRKKDRAIIIEDLGKNKLDEIIVSTQVIEAGVDISFSQIFREAAPLDNIVQVMGRLNREGEEKDAKLIIFKEKKDDWKPYNELEWSESLKILKTISNSFDLYKKLPDYYQAISNKNQRYKDLADSLDSSMKNLAFEDVWNFVSRHVMPDEFGETVYLPETEEDWHEIKNAFLNHKKSIVKKYMSYTALLSSQAVRRMENYFDEDLYENNILLPKFSYLNTVYDQNLGLDIWIQ